MADQDSDLREREDEDGDDVVEGAGGDSANGDDDFERNDRIVEAILLTADAPVSPGRLLGLFKGLSGHEIRQAIDDLNGRYEAGGHAMRIIEIAGGFQLSTLAEFGPWVRKFHDRGHVRLSQAALETLAIIAFKQPVTRIEVDNVRGVDSGGVIRTLMELNMIRLVGRSEALGRPMLFGTTKEFMVHFGLKSLADLPKPKELEELLAAGASKVREVANGPSEEDATASVGDATEADLGEDEEGGEAVLDAEVDVTDVSAGWQEAEEREGLGSDADEGDRADAG